MIKDTVKSLCNEGKKDEAVELISSAVMSGEITFDELDQVADPVYKSTLDEIAQLMGEIIEKAERCKGGA